MSGDTIPADILLAAEKALDNMLCHSRESSGSHAEYRKDTVNELALVILAERKRHSDLLEALRTFVTEYVELVESGDAGFWNAEDEPKVIKARAAIAKAEGRSA